MIQVKNNVFKLNQRKNSWKVYADKVNRNAVVKPLFFSFRLMLKILFFAKNQAKSEMFFFEIATLTKTAVFFLLKMLRTVCFLFSSHTYESKCESVLNCFLSSLLFLGNVSSTFLYLFLFVLISPLSVFLYN